MKKQKLFLYLYRVTNRILKKCAHIKIPLSQKILYYIISQTLPYPEFIRFDDYKINLLSQGKVSRELTYHRVFEKEQTELIKTLVKKGDIILDIGANIGYFTLIFSKLSGTTGKVFSFEPETTNFNVLRKNVEENNFKNIIIEKLAVSNQSGRKKLYLSEGPGGHRLFESNYCTKDFTFVDVITLDDYFENKSIIEKITLVKIDVEGAELSVLNGMKSILKQNKNLKILLEYYEPFIKESGYSPKELFDFLDNTGFFIYSINKKNSKKEIPNFFDDKYRIRGEEQLANESYETNLICVRK